MKWTRWRTLSPAVHCPSASLRETLDEGQAFRWREVSPDVWDGLWGTHRVQVRTGAGDKLQWRKPECLTTCAEEVAAYFDAGRDYATLVDALPWRSDAVLAQALGHFEGMRILRQPAGEALLIFLCSAMKQIPQIKRVCEQLALKYGEVLADGESLALPSWEKLASVPESALRETGMGFRAKNIYATAQRLAAEPAGWLEETAVLPWTQARERLLSLPGVGEKIADCVLLYGMNRLEAFPVDTWVRQAMGKLYGLEGWTESQIGLFGRTHFGAFAGVSQQYLFASVRRGRM